MNKRIDWVVNGKRYDRVSSTEIFWGESQSFFGGTKRLTFYKSPRGQFFIVKEDDGTIQLIDKQKMIESLGEFNAPSAAYRAAGIELQDG